MVMARSLVLLTPIGLLTGGCIFISETKTTTPPPAGVYAPSPGAANPRPALWANQEIEAAASLSFDSSRTEALEQIAGKRDLCPQSQVLLVDKTYSRLSFESSKVSVLSTLIDNPDFSNAAKEAIFAGLGRLSFESSKTELMTKINQRGALAW